MREICALPPSPIHLLSTRKPTVGGGAGFSGAWLPSAWRVLRPLPCALRFSAKATRGPAPGAPVFEPLHLTPDLYPPLDVALYSLLSFFVLLFCVRPRSYGHFTSPTPSMSPCGIFNKTRPSLFHQCSSGVPAPGLHTASVAFKVLGKLDGPQRGRMLGGIENTAKPRPSPNRPSPRKGTDTDIFIIYVRYVLVSAIRSSGQPDTIYRCQSYWLQLCRC